MFLPLGVSRIRPMFQPNLGCETCLSDKHACEAFENGSQQQPRGSFFDYGRPVPVVALGSTPSDVVCQGLPTRDIQQRYGFLIVRSTHRPRTTCVGQKHRAPHRTIARGRHGTMSINKTRHRVRDVVGHGRAGGPGCDLKPRRWSSESTIALARLEAGLRAM